MNTKSLVLGAFFALGLSSAVNATVTLQISQIGVGRATGFADQNGVVQDGMRWGVVVSTGNATFNSGSYDLFDMNTSGFLSVGGLLTDDYYVAHPTSALTAPLSATGGDPGGAGGITSINPVPFGGATNISSGDPFEIIWFAATPAAGSYYGMLGNQGASPQFDIPNDTDVYSVASFFAGPVADSPRTASFQFAPIPEPSRMMLVALGAIGVITRRRRR